MRPSPAEGDSDGSDRTDRATDRYHETWGIALSRSPRDYYGHTLAETHAALGDAKRLTALPRRRRGDERSIRGKLEAVEGTAEGQ